MRRLTEEVFLLKKAEAEEACDRNYKALMEEAPWLQTVHLNALKIADMNASKKVKYGHFVKLADRINAVLMKHSACQDHCARCCHIALSMPQHEADVIAQVTGRKARQLTLQLENRQEHVDRNMGKPCPFLVEDRCGIYEHRPIACRLHANLGASNFFCDTDIIPEQTMVPNFNSKNFIMVFTKTMLPMAFGDIRDFFPDYNN